MPGRTPAAAFRAFIEPLQAAAACLGNAKWVASEGGSTGDAGVHAVALNGFNGMALNDGFHLEAVIRYEFVMKDGQHAVSTRGYMYTLRHLGKEVFSIHWHPDGKSEYKMPHAHLPIAVGSKLVTKQHMPTGRMTFEHAVEWAINFGVTAARGDWPRILADTRDVHIKHRSWN